MTDEIFTGQHRLATIAIRWYVELDNGFENPPKEKSEPSTRQ